MSALITIIWLIGTVASIWFIIRPLSSLPIYATRGRAIATGAAIFIGLPIVAAIVGISSVPGPTLPKVRAAGAGGTTDGNSEVAAAAPASPWTYNENKDAMRGTTMKYAQTQSDEKFQNSLGMGEQNTVLEVQKLAKGYDVSINNPNLQFTCSSLVTKQFAVKFDDGPIDHYNCTDSEGSKFGLAFFSKGDGVVAKMRSAKRMMIEAEVFQRGNVQMTFNVAGLTL
ncbi:hypothetical protein [Sphingomonas mali]|uniref:hypothetical protein n=1 Tax=Sphingomonas mali TaxID=40682 RepID=UPI0008372431|nr:hypothetical protein [Sphingomonas mali]